MENSILRSDANPADAPQVQSASTDVAEAARLAVEKADSDRRAQDEERRRLADAEHASKVIAKANAEAKIHREKYEKEAAEREALAKRLKELEDKELAEKEQFKTLAEKRAAELEEERAASKKALEELKAERERERSEEQAGRILDAVTLAAVKAGILDEEDVTLPSFREAISMAKIEGGRVVGVTAAIAKMKELKPGKFKAEEPAGEEEPPKPKASANESTNRLPAPAPSVPKGKASDDASAWDDATWEARTAEFRRGRP